MKIEFKIIKEENDLKLGKEKERLISAIIYNLNFASNKRLYEALEIVMKGNE